MTGEARDEPKLEIDWVRTVAGALAAVSTTVLLSTLGAAGTLIGAAVGSVAATIGTALYSQGLNRSRRQLVRAQELARQKAGPARPAPPAVGAERSDPYATLYVERPAAHTEVDTAPASRLRALPWRRIAIWSATMFVVLIAAISVFELSVGRPVSSFTGGGGGSGTTLSHVTGRGSERSHDPADPTDASTPSPGQTPTTAPGDTSPGSDPTPEATSEATPTPQETPTADPTPDPSPEETPTTEDSSPEPTPAAEPTPNGEDAPDEAQ